MIDSAGYATKEKAERREERKPPNDRKESAGKNLSEQKASMLDRAVRVSGIVFYVRMSIGLTLMLTFGVPSVLGLRLYPFILLMFGLIALQDGLYGPVRIAAAGIVLSEVRVRYDIRRASSGVSRAV